VTTRRQLAEQPKPLAEADSSELSRRDRSQSDSGTGLDSSMGYGVNFVLAREAGPHFSREEWSRRLTPHIDKPLAGVETREIHIARLKRELAELEGAGVK